MLIDAQFIHCDFALVRWAKESWDQLYKKILSCSRLIPLDYRNDAPKALTILTSFRRVGSSIGNTSTRIGRKRGATRASDPRLPRRVAVRCQPLPSGEGSMSRSRTPCRTATSARSRMKSAVTLSPARMKSAIEVSIATAEWRWSSTSKWTTRWPRGLPVIFTV